MAFLLEMTELPLRKLPFSGGLLNFILRMGNKKCFTVINFTVIHKQRCTVRKNQQNLNVGLVVQSVMSATDTLGHRDVRTLGWIDFGF